MDAMTGHTVSLIFGYTCIQRGRWRFSMWHAATINTQQETNLVIDAALRDLAKQDMGYDTGNEYRAMGVLG